MQRCGNSSVIYAAVARLEAAAAPMTRRISTSKRFMENGHGRWCRVESSFVLTNRQQYISYGYQVHPGCSHDDGRRGLATHRGADDDNQGRSDSGIQKPEIILQKLGDFPYGSREYRLVLRRWENHDGEFKKVFHPVASLRAHRNIVFGAKLSGEPAQKRRLLDVCLPLLDAALEDASCEGEQPQGMATLYGLCDWVAQCDDDNNDKESETLKQLKLKDDETEYQAVRAIATGIPRPGHSVVGQGTFRDGKDSWEALADEFIKKELAEEVELYKARGGTVVLIEHLADNQPDYLRSAGGAMARLFFL